ncbi:MAG: NADH-quinone oxidoreductase subunit A [Ardenticatenaceae bacterium]|nr:NADH-quinone oxidoreductase subunit A [Ardenticatenaceae bacterium]HBY98565.1 NADH-quinone oxidoreductase subunit A [Chloroflexota bacterium]
MFPYVALGIFLVLATGLAILVIIIGEVFGPDRPTARKLAPYESGMQPIGNAMQRLPIRFYLTATLFIVFDIEVIFLFPWALIFRRVGLFALGEMAVFLLILVVGYYYIWMKGALEWD